MESLANSRSSSPSPQKWGGTTANQTLNHLFDTLLSPQSDNLPAVPPPFYRHFGSKESFGVPDEHEKLINEHIEKEAWNWKCDQKRKAQDEEKVAVKVRRERMRNLFQNKMRERYEASLLRGEPHAVRRLRRHIEDAGAALPSHLDISSRSQSRPSTAASRSRPTSSLYQRPHSASESRSPEEGEDLTELIAQRRAKGLTVTPPAPRPLGGIKRETRAFRKRPLAKYADSLQEDLLDPNQALRDLGEFERRMTTLGLASV